jgi:hypothetical protein
VGDTQISTNCSEPNSEPAPAPISPSDPPSTDIINQGINTAGDQYTAGWDGVIALDLTPLAHANPSFSSPTDIDFLTVDFGTVALNSVQSTIFSISNLYTTLDPGETVGLDLDSWTGSGDVTVLWATLANFSNLAPGTQSSNFNVSFDTSTPGNFSVTYTLDLSDADVGTGMDAYHMVLELIGIVRAQEGPNLAGAVEALEVPEPGTIASFGAGFFVVRWIARRRSRKSRQA